MLKKIQIWGLSIFTYVENTNYHSFRNLGKNDHNYLALSHNTNAVPYYILIYSKFGSLLIIISEVFACTKYEFNIFYFLIFFIQKEKLIPRQIFEYILFVLQKIFTLYDD